MSLQRVATNATVGVLSGAVAVKAMDSVTTKLYQWESPSDKKREQDVSPGPSYDIAARDLAGRLGIALSDEQAKMAGQDFHEGLGFAAGLIYLALRRWTNLSPLAAALIVALGLWAGLDEGLTPAMGWSAPDSAYPLATHLRGFVGHLTLGAVVALMVEVLSGMLGRRQ